MSLFPAYADSSENQAEELCSESLELEAQLLASDNDEEREPGAADVAGVADAGAASCGSHELGPSEQQDYYLDSKFDVGNLRVSTLYYPGRPQYKPVGALGNVKRERAGARAAPRRYFSEHAPAPDALADAELAQRTRAFRDMLADNPTDEALWLRFIEFQERTRDGDAALAAAGEAAARLRGCRRVRAALHRARALALAPAARLALLRRDLAAAAPGLGGDAGDAAELTELWLRVLAGACAEGVGAELDAAASAALAATRAHSLAYPHVLYVYGAALRAAGLWERLVLLLELALSMNFPPADFPPRVLPERIRQQEQQLQTFEDKVMSSGLPLSTMWVRVERARAASHWRVPPGPDPLDPRDPPPDPQRAPQPADVAELLRPAAGPAAALLLVQALRLAKVPLLPCSGYALAPVDAANDVLGDAYEADGAEGLLALLRAARRLPRAHPAYPEPALAARIVALFLDPPHYFTDDAGYLTWVSALWDAACGWLAGEQRVALLCWRLRWLHALLLLLDPQEEVGRRESRRMRGEARAALKRFAGTSPLPFAQFARVEHAAGATESARRAALQALRAALRDATVSPHARLYVARVAGELCGDAPGAWATACAALHLPLPPDEQLAAAPPRDLLQRALAAAEAQCDALEQCDDELAPSALDVMLPAPAEWASARARLAPPARRAELLRLLRAAPPPRGAARARYAEQAACALALQGAREGRLAQAARALLPLFPHNGLLALACSGAPLWAWDADSTQEERLRAMTCGARSHRAALAHALPPLLRAQAAAWQPAAAARVAAAAARAARAGAGGALLHAVRLHSEARAARPRPAAALYAALDRHPQHKWLAVRGAAWVPAQAAALADVLLERQLRAHTLLDELVPLPPPPLPPNAS